MNVSIIIPVFNAAHYLDKSIESALNQRQTHELLLIDDNSTDNSLEICRKWEKYDSRVKVFINNGRKGAGAARNVGLQNAACEFIAFLDADDFYLSNRFTTSEDIFKLQPNIDAVAEACIVEGLSSSCGRLIQYNKSNSKIDLKTFLLESDFSIIGLTLRKHCIQRIGMFNEKLLQAEDTDFLIRLITKCSVISGKLDQIVSIYNFHNFNTTKKTSESHFHRRNFHKMYLKISMDKFYHVSIVNHFFSRYLYYDFLVKRNNPDNFTFWDRLSVLPSSLIDLIFNQA